MISNNSSIILNLDNYAGLTPTEIIPPYMLNIHKAFQNLPEDTLERKSIDTYLRLLEYYFYVSNPSLPNTQYAIRFCNDLINHLDNYIKQKFPDKNIKIELKGRIKSPYSAIEKFRSEISKAIKSKEDLDTIQIKDLFAFRIIVTVFDEKGLIAGDDVTIPYCYDILEEAMKFAKQDKYIDWEPSHPRSNKHPEIVFPNIVLPESQPHFVIENEKYVKDYIMFPKDKTNYQSLHSKLKIKVPEAFENLFIEMQVRTGLMDKAAEYGLHLEYKERNIISFNRVPQILKETEPDGEIKLLTIEEAFKEFYGITIDQVVPGITIKDIQEFFELTDYKKPLSLFRITRSSTGEIIPSSAETLLPVEVVGILKENPTINDIAKDFFSDGK